MDNGLRMFPVQRLRRRLALGRSPVTPQGTSWSPAGLLTPLFLREGQGEAGEEGSQFLEGTRREHPRLVTTKTVSRTLPPAPGGLWVGGCVHESLTLENH